MAEAAATVPLTRTARLGLAAAAAFLLVGFATAAWLRPDPSGLGTHRQLGLSACSAKTLFGVPCPSCGLTTSLSHVMHGQLADAWRVQPVGVFIAAASAIALLVCGEAAIGGRWRLPIGPLALAVAAVWTINVVAIARWIVVVLM